MVAGAEIHQEETFRPKLTRRKVNHAFEQDRSISSWYQGDVVKTAFLNAYSLLIPDGEKFIIRNVKAFDAFFSEGLRNEVGTMFYQESLHSKEHRKAVEFLEARGYRVERFMRGVNRFCYGVLEPKFPKVLRLSTASGIEHINAVIAAHFLYEGTLEKGDSEMAKLFLWHFLEELEHKETAFKALLAVSDSYWLRAAGMLMAASNFIGLLMLGTLKCLVYARAVRRPRTLVDTARFTFGRKGLGLRLLAGCLDYLRADFFPDSAATAQLVQRISSMLRQQAHVVTPLEPVEPIVKPAGDLPAPARRLLRKLTAFRKAFPFFFASCSNQGISWVDVDGAKKVNFCTYSYLGLVKHRQIVAAAKRALDRYGSGTHGVRLLGGTLNLHVELEQKIARFLKRDACLTFSSGYVANISVISALFDKNSVIFMDHLSHTSIQDGCKLSGAEVVTFPHNDTEALEALMQRAPERARKLIVVDGVYSMDGDLAPLPDLVALKRRYANTCLLIDDAHALGVVGKAGRGLEAHFDLVGAADLIVGTLSKTIPAQGGFVAGSKDLIDFLRHAARGYVFSAALTPASVAAASAAFDVLEREGEVRRRRLAKNIRHFIAGLRALGFEVPDTESAIIPVMIRSERQVFELCQYCHDAGLALKPVVFPAVAKGTERIRANVTSEHGQRELDFALATLARAKAQLKIGRPEMASVKEGL